ncbi:HD domain-containing protein [Geobacter pickeringii]|uniref:HD family phosphohydrolase n=1 Tax=Geobacter pickeringii TaxID=345632 RepID=A0A0B5BGV4_9BACT|nr:HD domain-containing protein [Geobacter pickeringii]AJE03745.1 HD family phosphohydrolase [Geobacter pickeringii]
MDDATLSALRCWFRDYCRTFYTDNEDDNRNIRLKEEHTAQVCATMELLADSLALAPADRRLAAAVALFHDVGRFEQFRRYRTFKDSASVNHAALGARVLAEEGVLAGVAEGERRLIASTVGLHNVFRIPAGLDERHLLFLRLIRDADKLDIWRVFIEFYRQPAGERASAVSLGFPDIPHCTPAVVDTLLGGEMVDLATLRTLNDFKLLQLSWVFDLNFSCSRQVVRERGYVELIADMIPRQGDVARAIEVVRDALSPREPDSGAAGAVGRC